MTLQNRVFLWTVMGPPPIKRRARGGNHFTPKQTVEDEARVRKTFQDFYLHDPRSESKFSVEIRIYSNRNFDGDNVEKAVLDAMNKVLWENDRQVRQVTWMKFDVGHMDYDECIVIKALEL